MTNNLNNINNNLNKIYSETEALKNNLGDNKYIIAKIGHLNNTEIVYKTSSLTGFVWFVLTHLPDLVKNRMNFKFGDSARACLLLNLKDLFATIAKTTDSTIKINEKNITPLKEISEQVNKIRKNFDLIHHETVEDLPDDFSLLEKKLDLRFSFEQRLDTISKSEIQGSNIKDLCLDFERTHKNINELEAEINKFSEFLDEEFIKNLTDKIETVRNKINHQLRDPFVKEYEQVDLEFMKKNRELTNSPLWKEIGELSNFKNHLRTLKKQLLEIRDKETLLNLQIKISSLEALSPGIDKLEELRTKRHAIATKMNEIAGFLNTMLSRRVIQKL